MFKYYMAKVLILLLLFPLFAHGQRENLPHNSAPKAIFSHQFFFLDEAPYYFIDTSFNHLHTYHQWNAAFSDLYAYSALSNMGAPLNPLSLPQAKSPWMMGSAKAYAPYFIQQNKVPFYITRSPLTEAQYWMGYDRGQSFRIYHTQNITRHWNFLVNYRRTNALGQYDHSQNKMSSFLFNTHYSDPNSAYEARSYFSSEKITTEENGGLADLEEFFEEAEANRILLEVNLPQDGRVMRNRQFYLDHKLKINRLLKSSADSSPRKPSENYIALGHESKYDRITDTYIGSSEEYYQNYFYSNAAYRDSNLYRGFSNSLYLQTNLGDSTSLNLKGGLKHLYTQYGAEQYQFVGNHLGITGNLNGRLKENLELNAQLDYIFSGTLAQTFLLNARASWRLWRSLGITGGYKISRRFPDFYQQYYYSNNYIWENDFQAELRNEVHYGLQWQKVNYLKITHFRADNYTFYNASALPEQSDNVQALRIEVQQNFNFWNLLHLDNRMSYQSTTDAQNALPLPEWISRNALYFEFALFKDELQCLAGVEGKYFSPYFSPSYNPALGDFYTLNERRIGGYPQLDVFANFQIKKAQIFVKLENAAQGWPDNNYFASPRYPLPDRTLRAGIRWRFFN